MTFRFKRGIKRIGDWVVSEGKNEIGRMLKILNLPMVNSSCFFQTWSIGETIKYHILSTYR